MYTRIYIFFSTSVSTRNKIAPAIKNACALCSLFCAIFFFVFVSVAYQRNNKLIIQAVHVPRGVS